MARVLKFRKHLTDTTLLTAPYDFVSVGIEPTQEEGTVTDVIELLLIGTNAQIISGAVDLDTFAVEAQEWFNDNLLQYMIWIYLQADGESNKRALVKDVKVKHSEDNIFHSLLGREGIRLQIAVEHYAWESDLFDNVSGDAVSAWGGVVDITSGIDGTLRGRPYKVSVLGDNGGGGPITQFWLGLRRLYEGKDNFDPVLELEKGTMGTDAVVASETGASPSGSSSNNKVRVTFATTSLAKRLSLQLSQAVFAGSTYLGEYAMLLRSKVSAGSMIGVQARTGLKGSASFAPNEEVYNIQNTNWMLTNIGFIQIPPIGYRADQRDINSLAVVNTTIELWSEVVTSNGGTDWIDLDAIVLIPARHMVAVNGAAINYIASRDYVLLLTFANGTQQALSYVNGGPDAGVEARFNNWVFPHDPGIMVFAAQRANSHVLTDHATVEYLYYPRWRTYRGA